MPTDRARHIPELLVIHADELAFLWGQRRAAVHDARYTLKAFVGLNDRVESHVQGLLAVPSALPELLMPRVLEARERDEVFAAGHALLRLSEPAVTQRVVLAFAAASAEQLLGLRDALGFAPLGNSAPDVHAMLAGAPPPQALAAATVLAHHGRLEPDEPRLNALLMDDDPQVCEQAWRVLGWVDGKHAARNGANAAAPPRRPYKPALDRPEAAVRRAALGAAVWTAQPWALPGIRKLAADGDAAAFGWLAALGTGEDWPAILVACHAMDDATQRPDLLARAGHPLALEPLEAFMRVDDAVVVDASIDSFSRITGVDVRGTRSTAPVADDADDFAREFAPSVWRADLAAVASYRKTSEQRLAAGTRWNRGIRVDGAPALADLAKVDLPARWDACARAALAGRPMSSPPPVF
ncbi:hypothetical protein BH11PSE9_BH11PSE9_04250 [soil metagenome]